MAGRSPRERTLEAQILGRDVRFDYSETWVAWSVLSLRVIMAWVFLQAGLEKLFGDGISGFLENPLTGGWSAEGYLSPDTPFGVSPDTPLSGIFAEMSANAALIDPLVAWGQVLIGLALLFGIMVRFAAFMGSLQMFLFWWAALQGGLLAGLPVEHGWVVDSSLVYIFILFGLGAVGAGRILGFDAQIEEWPVVQDNPWLKYLLG